MITVTVPRPTEGVDYGTSPIEPDAVYEKRILDSGNRREFESGAVRDIQEGKGRCDLMPLDIAAKLFGKTMRRDESYEPLGYDPVLIDIAGFKEYGDPDALYTAMDVFSLRRNWDIPTMFLEVSKHFEEGAKKYGENNWQKGIPVHCYIDSAVRHYLKFLRGDDDEPHDRAFCWNIMCAIWTCIHKPELNEYKKGQ